MLKKIIKYITLWFCIAIILLSGGSVSKASTSENSDASMKAYLQMSMEAIKQYKANVIDIQGMKEVVGITPEILKRIRKMDDMPMDKPVMGLLVEIGEDFPDFLLQTIDEKNNNTSLNGNQKALIMQRIPESIGNMLVAQDGVDAVVANSTLRSTCIYSRPSEIKKSAVMILLYEEGKKSCMAVVSFTINNQDFVQVGVSGVIFQKKLIERLKNADGFKEVFTKWIKYSGDALKITIISEQEIDLLRLKEGETKKFGNK